MRITLLALLAALAAIPAQADPIPGVTLTPVSANVFLTTIAGAGTYGSGVYPGFDSMYPGLVEEHSAGYSFGGETAYLLAGNQGGSDPAVFSNLEVGGIISGTLPSQKFDSRSIMSYEFAVNGPAGQTVPITFTGAGFASAIVGPSNGAGVPGADFGAEAILTLSPASGATFANSYSALACSGDTSHMFNLLCLNTSGTSTSFDISTAFSVQTDTAYVVNLTTEDYFTDTLTGSPIPGLGEIRSYVDPTITLDTSDPAYSLEFSPGLLGASPTPEPGSLLLVATGLAGAAALMRGRLQGLQ